MMQKYLTVPQIHGPHPDKNILENYITLEKCHDLVYENMEDKIHDKV